MCRLLKKSYWLYKMTDPIRVRTCLVVINDSRLLLVPHYQTDVGAVQWNIPGGKVEFGESLEAAALREFQEETGLTAALIGLFETSEVILPARPYHSITIAFSGRLLGGELRPEPAHGYGEKIPRWFSANEVVKVAYHPPKIVEKALDIIPRR